MSVNKVILIGNAGKDPEVRYLENEMVICKFPLATSESYKNKNGEEVTNTEWHNIVMFRGLAKIAEKYVTKGKQVFIEGRIRSRSYDDKDGNKRYITEIVGDSMTLLGGGRPSGEAAAGSERQPEPNSAPLPDNSPEPDAPQDDLPF